MRFGDLYEIPSRNGLTKPRAIRGEGIKFINMGELFENDRIGDIEMDRAPVTEKEFVEALVEEGDLLFARQSLVREGAGKCSIVTEVKEPTTFDSHLIRVRLKRELANPNFYRFYFSSHLSPIPGIVSQCAQAGIKGNDLKELDVICPPIHQQDRIAEILSAHDELIENNRKQIKLLEEAAQRLYKEWFVDLRFPGHETASIDPATNLPEGWRVLSAADVFPITIGKTPSRKDSSAFSNEGIPWVSVSDMGKEGSIILSTSECLTQEGINSYKVKTVPEGSVLLSFKLTVGRVSIAGCTMASNEAIAHFVTDNNALRNYCFLYLKDFDFSKLGSTSSIGTAINSKIVKALPFVLPDETTLKSFDDVASSIIELIISNKRQIALLQEARDRMLPKLMSGEIEVD